MASTKKTASSEEEWSPRSWRSKPITQQPKYEDLEALKRAEEKLSALPPLTTSSEVMRLRNELAEVAKGKRFLLQGGDCAERFDDCKRDTIEKKLKILIQMALILTWGGKQRVVKIARMAGQYSKPRSSDWETLPSGKRVPSFRGDNVNRFEPTNRDPNPGRLVEGYFHSAATLNFVRGAMGSGLADLSEAKHWSLGFVVDKHQRTVYEDIVEKVMDSVAFAGVCGFGDNEEIHRAEMFVSHEGLSLPYEEAMTAKGPDGKYYNLGAHMLWIGNRTRQLDHAHVEFFRGIENPIGIKIGPKMPTDAIVPLIRTLWPNPRDAPGKIVLITRVGAANVKKLLPNIIRPVLESGLPVVWSCDPMHGNTRKTASGIKTRQVSDVLAELRLSFEIHRQMGSRLGGVHLEMTGENVTECVGGPEDLFETDLPKRYTSYCDPRLNYAQSLQVAFLVTQHLREQQREQQQEQQALRIASTGSEPPRKRKKTEEGGDDDDAK